MSLCAKWIPVYRIATKEADPGKPVTIEVVICDFHRNTKKRKLIRKVIKTKCARLLVHFQYRSQKGGGDNFKLVMIQSSHRFGLAALASRLVSRPNRLT